MKSKNLGFSPLLGIIFVSILALSLVASLILIKTGVVLKSRASQSAMPLDIPAKGLVYRDLEKSEDGTCPEGFILHASTQTSGRARCTHGPDEAFEGFSVTEKVKPIDNTNKPVLGEGIVCNGDGKSGNRVEAIYVRASDRVDSYDQYYASFQQWLSNMDLIFYRSAVETGGERHVRFVQDPSTCAPLISKAAISPTGVSSFTNTVNELQALGFNRPDRKYLLFVDTTGVYCGIADIQYDDSASSTNLNNLGPHYARVDSGCWNEMPLAHELSHTLGAVQMTAPNSSLEWHCTDQSDTMCRPTNGTPTVQKCPYLGYFTLDCNHNDYFSTNPPAGSYLSAHWNLANSSYLIGANPLLPPILSKYLETDKKTSKGLTTTSTFSSRDTVYLKFKSVDKNTSPLAKASSSVSILKPDTTKLCTLTISSDSTGTVTGNCKLPSNSPKGTWKVVVNNLSLSGYQFDPAESTVIATFTVQ